MLKACSKLLALKQGKTVHAQILKLGFSLDVYTQTALLDFYGSCGEILAVRYLFDRMPERDVVCWNAVVASHVRCGLVDDAEEVFEVMPVRNVSSWTTMIGGFVQTGKSVEALALFHRMQMDGVKPDKMAVVTILSAIADLGVLDLGRWVHDYVEKNGIRIDAFVGTALIDMYSKCGSVRAARAVFDAIGSKTIICYNVMIMGFAIHGMGEEAIEVFKEAGQMGMGVNDTTMIAILSACSNSGLVDEGCRCFNLMKEDYGIEAKMEHYRCMIDILGRAGRFDEAMEIVGTKKADPLVLGMLASACRIHGNFELGDELAGRMSELDPTISELLVVKSNLCAADGRWEEAAAVRRSMKDIGMGKRPGCSWIEVNNVVHEFVAGDHLHPCSKEIYSKLAELNEKMKSFVPKD